MLNVGLTGNVAAGKSTAVRWFAEWGATVVDADELARDVQRPGSPVLAAIGQRFGNHVLRPDGSLDRAALRKAVMSDEDALATLNAIVHPAVRRERAHRAAAADARGDCILVNDIPLLFEVLDPADFDLVVLVDAATEVRRSRLTSLRGLSVDEADQLIAAQLPSKPKRARADIVLDNDGSSDAFRDAAWRAWKRIRARAAAKAAEAEGPLLVVFAHPGDESLLTGGTLARYADAGKRVHLLLTERRGNEVRAAAALLGLREVIALGDDIGPLLPDDERAATALARLVSHVAPAAVISYGAEGVDGDLARRTVHTLARHACARMIPHPTIYFVALPQSEALRLSPTLHPSAPQGIVARLDVRPWRDRKGAAVEAYGERLALARDPAAWVGLERECYGSDDTGFGPAADLFAPAARPG
jgi:dephospho-CoA kinase